MLVGAAEHAIGIHAYLTDLGYLADSKPIADSRQL
jgi:hypothetical protein